MSPSSLLKIRQLAPDELRPYERNPRTHTEAQIDAIARSIEEFGFNNPILVDGGNGIIAGHGRLLAARKLGLKRVPVLELSHLSDQQKRAYVIADNQLALQAGWDFELLQGEMSELRDADFDLSLLGFSTDELKHIEAGWIGNEEAVNRHGENLDGIKGKVVVLCAQEQVEMVEQVIRQALDAAGMDDVTFA